MKLKSPNCNKYNSFISWVCILVVCTGILVAIGWMLDIKILKTIQHNYPPMKLNTAVGFILLGLSLFICVKNPGARWVLFGKVISFVVAIMGAVTFSQELFNYDAGIDQLLKKDYGQTGIDAIYQSRMSGAAAISFVICGMYLISFDVKNKLFRLAAHWLLHLVTIISFIAIVGYLFDVPVFYKLSFITPMALHTSVLFFLFSIAASLMHSSIGITGLFTNMGIGNVMANKIFFQLAIAVLVLGYFRILAHRYELINVELGIALHSISFILVSLVLIGLVSKKLNAINEKKLEAEDSLSKLTTFLNATPDPIIIVDSEGIIKLANDEAERHFGYEKKALIGQPINLLIPGRFTVGYKGQMFELLSALRQGTISSGADMYALRKNGKEFPVEITTSPVETTDGLFISAAIRDISERKRQEKEIKEMAKIIANSSNAIFSRDLSGKILSWNNGAKELTGYNAQEMIGRNVSLLFPHEPLDEVITQANRILDNQYINQHETSIAKKDGTVATVSITTSPILDDKESVIAVSLIVRDITEHKAAQILQKESSERNKFFIQQAPHALAMFDTDMRYLAASKKWLQDYGLSGKDIISHSHYEIFPEIGDDWKAIHQACLKGEINQCDEAEFIRADGSSQWITWDVRPWYITEESIGGILMYTADITLVKQKEQDKRKVEAILDKTSEVARIGTWEFDILKNKITWSNIIKEIHEVGIDYEPELNSAINFFREGASREKIENAVQEAIKNGTTYDLEIELVTAKCNIIWVRAIGQAEFKNGVCQRLYGIFQDVDETIKSRQTLQKLNGELSTLLNAGYVSIIGTDNNGLITHFNKGAEIMLQYAASEMIGIQSPEIIHLKDEIVKRGNELSERYGLPISGFDAFVEKARRESFDSKEWTYVRKDGYAFPVQLVVTAIRNKLGETIGFIGVATDISNIKNAEKKLQESNESIKTINRQLNQKNDELEQFAFLAAHDLQEPLRMISSFLSLLEQKYTALLDDKGRQYIRYSVDGALRMRDLIRDILDFSKSGTVNNVELNLNKLVQGIAIDYKNDEKYQSAIIEVDALPVINADATGMQQLFTNIIGNGLKYQPPGNVPVIKVTAKELNDKWLFKIADNGIGIDPKQYDKVFAIFKRLHSKSTYAGTGIGLATCKKIVGLYNGDIWIEANEGNGSVFCFTISG